MTDGAGNFQQAQQSRSYRKSIAKEAKLQDCFRGEVLNFITAAANELENEVDDDEDDAPET